MLFGFTHALFINFEGSSICLIYSKQIKSEHVSILHNFKSCDYVYLSINVDAYFDSML